ncbi:metallophosphoesterase [Endobacterium cereale]|uniref:metallophosphoesterase n=1 Tax=Endobacterium cereale TaxID=2663029 RepID=UPI002B47F10A|nr:metallophosphoesterase [Endobacterium cereale]MEB2848107.1 metallophosphoesterase [Endobacterium cereale]
MHGDQGHTFAIGDIHGRVDLLKALLGHIADRANKGGFRYRVVFLGDIIDKGPTSFEAMELVIETTTTVQGSRLILGNHDAIPLTILDEAEPTKARARLAFWIERQNGMATLQSYRLSPETLTLKKFAEEFNHTHVSFLRAAVHHVELDNHILVHAGLRPGIPLAEQDPYDLMWIKEPFLSYPSSFGKTIIHGHTPTKSRLPEVLPNRIGIDTGACTSGRLTAVHLIGAEIAGYLATSNEGPIAVSAIEPMRL